jgi:hypothetical protein
VAGESGSVGINGESRIVNNTQVSGSWVTHAAAFGIGNANIGGSMTAASGLSVTGNVDIAKDLSVGGDLSGFDRLDVKGALRVSGTNRMIGFSRAASNGAYAAPAGPPCPCQPSQILDVKAKVAAAAQKNDNASLGLPKSLAAIGVAILELPTGSYYFNDLKTIGLTRIKVSGAVALHFDGDYLSIGADLIDIAPGGSLDLYVSGVVRTIGYVRAGEKSAPSAFRLYIGGGDRVSLEVGAEIFNGSIYAPTATIVYVGHTVIRGGLFAKDVTGIGNLEIRAAKPVAPDPGICGQPDPAPVPPTVPTPTDTPVIM